MKSKKRYEHYFHNSDLHYCSIQLQINLKYEYFEIIIKAKKRCPEKNTFVITRKSNDL